jgi:hypothetical protein
MTTREAQSLRAGDRVTWAGDSAHQGKVVHAGPAGVTILWDRAGLGHSTHRFDCPLDLLFLGSSED